MSRGVEIEDLRAALQGLCIDGIIHLASYGVVPADRDETLLHDVNVRFGANLAAVAAEFGARCMVAAGSSAEYAGPAARPFREDDPLEDVAPYGHSKAVGGKRFLESADKAGLRSLVLRLFNVYGPGEAPHRLLPSLVSSLLRNERVPLSPGEQIRDFLYVDDVAGSLVDACRRIESAPISESVLNLATGTGLSVRSFAERVASCMGKDQALLDFGAIPQRPHEQMLVVGDPARYRSALGFILPTGVEAGIRKTVEI